MMVHYYGAPVEKLRRSWEKVRELAVFVSLHP
jgi:hypothetical protein